MVDFIWEVGNQMTKVDIKRGWESKLLLKNSYIKAVSRIINVTVKGQ
jgi:hypothetical protein